MSKSQKSQGDSPYVSSERRAAVRSPWLSGPSSSVVHFVCLACAFGSRLVSQKAAM